MEQAVRERLMFIDVYADRQLRGVGLVKKLMEEHRMRHLNREYSFDATVNYEDDEKEITHADWYPSIDACLVAMRKLIEDEAEATSFVFNVVVRDHD